MKHLILLSFLLPVSASLCAQNAEDTVSTVNIESNRIQLPVSQSGRNIIIVDAQTIQKLPVKSIAELLTYVAGIDVRQRGPWGTQADIGIQGGTFDQSLLLLDGIRLTDPQTGHNQFNIPIPLEMIDHIEILKGPAARVYGINAIAGAINIVTRKPAKKEIFARVYSGSSFQKDTSNQQTYMSYGAGVSAGFTKGKVAQIFSAGWDQGNGYRYNTAFTNSRYLSKTMVRVAPNQTLSFLAGYVYNGFGANAFYSAPGDKESHETVQNTLASVQYDAYINKWHILPRFSYRNNYDNYIYKRQKPELYHNRHFTDVYNAEINVSRRFKFGQVGLGGEYRKDQINSNNLGKREREIYAVSVDFSYTQINKLTIVGGLYAMQHSQYGMHVFPGLEMCYRPSSSASIFWNAGTGQRLPTYTDLYYIGPSNIANPDLKPENSLATELGVRKKNKWFNAQASVFIRNINQLIDWVKDSTTAPWSPINYNTSRTTGAEINVQIFPFINVTNGLLNSLNIQASYTYLHPEFLAEVTRNYSKNAVEILGQQAIGRINGKIGPAFSYTLSGRYLVRNNLKAYFVADVRVQYAFKRFSIFADATNIGNTQYSEIITVPLTPRWIAIGLKTALH